MHIDYYCLRLCQHDFLAVCILCIAKLEGVFMNLKVQHWACCSRNNAFITDFASKCLANRSKIHIKAYFSKNFPWGHTPDPLILLQCMCTPFQFSGSTPQRCTHASTQESTFALYIYQGTLTGSVHTHTQHVLLPIDSFNLLSIADIVLQCMLSFTLHFPLDTFVRIHSTTQNH